MEDDWDLQAVVRGYSAAAGDSIARDACVQLFSPFHQNHPFCSTSQDPFEARKENFVLDLQNLYKPFFPKPEPPQTVFAQKSSPVSLLSVLGRWQAQSTDLQQSLQVVRQKPNNRSSSRSKRRKNNLKRVCHVPAESLSSDMWSWRKYGQKPIKGSPYPRGYYKCSTLKGCLARKQVERNRSDPGMFILTYTAEHNHPMPTQRNSLAGGTRQKPATPSTDDPSKQALSPAVSPVNPDTPEPEKPESSRDDRVEGHENDNEFNVSNMALEDDFFAGLEDFNVGPMTENRFSDHLQASFQFPWLATQSTTGAGGGRPDKKCLDH